MTYYKRWKGKDPAEVSRRMSELARKRVEKMSGEERAKHARVMVNARGKWIEGKYVRAGRKAKST